ncbi:hypothetical protein [Candidatus Rhabdochlamydia oedothoracis]|nr:hypothetical protein [Candidatus Rhabdochlamydia oedothoracis]
MPFSNELPMNLKNATNMFSSHRKIDRVAKVKIGNGFTDSKYGNIPRSKRIHARHKRPRVIEPVYEVSVEYMTSLVIDYRTCRTEKQVCNSSLKEKESTIAQLEEQCSRSTRYKKSSEKPTTIFELTHSTTAPEITVNHTKLPPTVLNLIADLNTCRTENQVCNSSLKEKESMIAQLEEQCSRSTRYKKSSEKPTTIFELTHSTTAPETTVKQTKPTAATSTAIPEPTTTTEPKITKSTNIQRGIALIGLALFATGSLLAGIFMFKKKRRCQHSLHLANNLKTSQRQGHTQVQGQRMKILLDS